MLVGLRIHPFTLRILPFALRILPLVALLLLPAGISRALVVISQVGNEATEGEDLSVTLTGGFLNDADHAWTHVYAPIVGEVILSATLRIDTLDADDGQLDLYAGIDETGTPIGTATGYDQGLPGIWRDLSQPGGPDPGGTDASVGAADNLLVLGPEHYADLLDGTFQVFADNRIIDNLPSLGAWGSNRAILTIVTGVPEPSTALLLGTGLLGLTIAGRRRGAAARAGGD